METRIKCTYADIYDSSAKKTGKRLMGNKAVVGIATGNSFVKNGRLYVGCTNIPGELRSNELFFLKRAVEIEETNTDTPPTEETNTDTPPTEETTSTGSKGLLLGLAALLFMDF